MAKSTLERMIHKARAAGKSGEAESARGELSELRDAINQRNTAWGELRFIRDAIGANPEESTYDEVQRVLAGRDQEIKRLHELCERLQQKAEIHAQEARTANATIREIYQLCTGATGEPGNWHGAEPVRRIVNELEQERDIRSDRETQLQMIAKAVRLDDEPHQTYWERLQERVHKLNESEAENARLVRHVSRMERTLKSLSRRSLEKMDREDFLRISSLSSFFEGGTEDVTSPPESERDFEGSDGGPLPGEPGNPNPSFTDAHHTPEQTRCPLGGRWHYGNGALVCGTIRVASLSLDTDPRQETVDQLGEWMAITLNESADDAMPENPWAGELESDTPEQPDGPMRGPENSKGDFYGVCPKCERSLEEHVTFYCPDCDTPEQAHGDALAALERVSSASLSHLLPRDSDDMQANLDAIAILRRHLTASGVPKGDYHEGFEEGMRAGHGVPEDNND